MTTMKQFYRVKHSINMLNNKNNKNNEEKILKLKPSMSLDQIAAEILYGFTKKLMAT